MKIFIFLSVSVNAQNKGNASSIQISYIKLLNIKTYNRTVLKIDHSFSTTNVFKHTIEGDSEQLNIAREKKESPSAHTIV